ncbi:hypothetical protein EA472_03435 [Natrarchaeobius oligotrophus]|uniref:Uncharacterized protein n=1 Tax=Natrarchaeobius chitinivorans TaxID=1679083 RepID=A0A3N6N3V7_NATCH|nr:hypothetical protein EA472_03435 [Natrarchaeobius chitinivorans]
MHLYGHRTKADGLTRSSVASEPNASSRTELRSIRGRSERVGTVDETRARSSPEPRLRDTHREREGKED